MSNKNKQEDHPLRPCDCWLDAGECRCDYTDKSQKLAFPYWEEIPKFNKKNEEE